MTLDLVPFDAARAAVLGACVTLEADHIPLESASGRVLAETLHAREDIVPYARSAMDGFALRAADTAAGVSLTVTGSAFAGSPALQPSGEPMELSVGTAAAIATGAPLPAGADAVVPIEDVQRRNGAIVLGSVLAAGEHVFPAGDDARAGDVLASAGSVLDPGTLAYLAAAGFSTAACTRKPAVALITTGDEVVAVEATPGFGQVRNSNATLLVATLAGAGATIAYRRHIRDDRDALRAALRDAVASGDLAITTGGASVGERDYMKALLEELGATFLFRSVALRPGRPIAFALLGGVPVLVLPGNPASAFTGLHGFGLPALRKLEGQVAPLPYRTRARLRGDLHGKSDKTFLAFCALGVASDGVLDARPLDNQCSALTRTAAEAKGFAVVEPERGDVRDGEFLDVEFFARSALA